MICIGWFVLYLVADVSSFISMATNASSKATLVAIFLANFVPIFVLTANLFISRRTWSFPTRKTRLTHNLDRGRLRESNSLRRSEEPIVLTTRLAMLLVREEAFGALFIPHRSSLWARYPKTPHASRLLQPQPVRELASQLISWRLLRSLSNWESQSRDDFNFSKYFHKESTSRFVNKAPV